MALHYIEADPLPLVCQICEDEQTRLGTVEDCSVCEHAGERCYLSTKDELLRQKQMAQMAIRHYERKIEQIDQALQELANQQ